MYAEFSPIPTMLFKQNISRILKVDVFGYIKTKIIEKLNNDKSIFKLLFLLNFLLCNAYYLHSLFQILFRSKNFLIKIVTA